MITFKVFKTPWLHMVTLVMVHLSSVPVAPFWCSSLPLRCLQHYGFRVAIYTLKVLLMSISVLIIKYINSILSNDDKTLYYIRDFLSINDL